MEGKKIFIFKNMRLLKTFDLRLPFDKEIQFLYSTSSIIREKEMQIYLQILPYVLESDQ